MPDASVQQIVKLLTVRFRQLTREERESYEAQAKAAVAAAKA